MRKNTPEDFWRKLDKSGECWLFTGALYKDSGYGQACYGGRSLRAHRLAWMLTFGPIPKGLNVLHRCDVPLCCNPSHLFLGTQADNIHDMVNKGRCWKQKITHCPKGHPYSFKNTHRKLDHRSGRPKRECRECNRERAARWRDAHPGANAANTKRWREKKKAL